MVYPMAPRSSQNFSPNAAEDVSPATKHGFMHTLRKSLSSISLSSRKNTETASSNASSHRKQPQGASNIYNDSFDISQVPKDAFTFVLRVALASPGQDYTSPYFNGGLEHVRRSHSMCDLSHMALTTETTDSADQLSPHSPQQPNVVDVVSLNDEPVVPLSPRTPHCREARVPHSSSAANMQIDSCEDTYESSESRDCRISTSYDWLFNSPLGQRPKAFRAEALDLIGSDPFRWISTRAQISELQKGLQVPQSTASGALALTTSTSHEQMHSISELKHNKPHDKGHQEVVPHPLTSTEDRTSGGERKGKVQPLQTDIVQCPEIRF